MNGILDIRNFIYNNTFDYYIITLNDGSTHCLSQNDIDRVVSEFGGNIHDWHNFYRQMYL